VSLLRPVIARSLRRARALAESLDARGFDPVAPRAVRKPLRFGIVDVVVVSLATSATAAALVARLAYVAYTSELAWFPQLAPLYAFVRAWL
jgi:energy-coupling factor transporter transmembrane protein EcfT